MKPRRVFRFANKTRIVVRFRAKIHYNQHEERFDEYCVGLWETDGFGSAVLTICSKRSLKERIITTLHEIEHHLHDDPGTVRLKHQEDYDKMARWVYQITHATDWGGTR